MMRPLIGCLLFTLLASTSSGQAPEIAPTSTKNPATSFTETLLKFRGISGKTDTLKQGRDELISGELWLADLQARSTRAVTSSGGYRSPIFLAGDKDVIALRGTDVVRLPKAGGEGNKLYSIDGIVKLVGASSEDAATVLILLVGGTGGHPRIGLLTVSTGAVTHVPYHTLRDQQMVEELAGWTRTYGNRQVYLRRQSKQALSGTVEWSDVFLQVGSQPPVDVSQCDGVDCGQPSLSADGHWLVFVRAKEE